MPVIGKRITQQDDSNENPIPTSKNSNEKIALGKHFAHPVVLDIKVADVDEPRLYFDLRKLYPKKRFSVRYRKNAWSHDGDTNGAHKFLHIQVTIRLKTHR